MWPEKEVHFPLRELWERDNLSMQGVEARTRLADDACLVSHPDDEDGNGGVEDNLFGDYSRPVRSGRASGDVQDDSPPMPPLEQTLDEWGEGEGTWTRIPRTPRIHLFHPDDVIDGPQIDVDINNGGSIWI